MNSVGLGGSFWDHYRGQTGFTQRTKFIISSFHLKKTELDFFRNLVLDKTGCTIIVIVLLNFIPGQIAVSLKDEIYNEIRTQSDKTNFGGKFWYFCKIQCWICDSEEKQSYVTFMLDFRLIVSQNSYAANTSPAE